MKNMITAIIDTEQKYCHAVSNLWQYDYGQILRIQGVTLPAAVEVQFSLTERAGAAITQIGVTKDGVTEVSIPDALLEGGTTSQDYTIYAFVYIEDGESGNTEHRISMKVRARPKPQPYEAAVASAEMAQDAAKKSESARQNVEADAEKVQKNVELIENYMNVKYERAYIQSHTFEEATKLAIELDNMRHALVFIRLDPGATASNYGLVSFFDDVGANKGALAELGSLASITSYRTALIRFESGEPVQFTRWGEQGGTGQMVVRNGSVGNYAVGIAQMDYFKLSKIVLPPITGTVNICIWGC